MRLIHIETLELHEFVREYVPPYVILSHRWEGNEISFKDVKKGRNFDSLGWLKIQNFCRFVRENVDNLSGTQNTLEYVWVDTCCIDKRSSAELSEAINSMYGWYQNALACYVYLSDVPSGNEIVVHQALRESRWFTRGWTLQELLASRKLYFVDKDWTTVLGTHKTFANIISETSRIYGVFSETDLPQRRFDPHYGGFSVAQKMSWASRRSCTRAEDHAYCLIGLFGVSMPLLYGEGSRKAFQRLQQEILKTSDDESIFAWSDDEMYLPTMFAASPAYFRHSENICRGPWDAGRPEFSVTSKGLRFEASTTCHITWTDSVYRIQLLPFPLNCHFDGDLNRPFTVLLRRLEQRYYTRVQESELENRSELRDQILACMSENHGNAREFIYVERRYGRSRRMAVNSKG